MDSGCSSDSRCHSGRIHFQDAIRRMILIVAGNRLLAVSSMISLAIVA